MGRGLSLSDETRGMIIAFHKANYSMSAIAENVNCSKNAALRKPKHVKRVRRPRKLSTQAISLIIRKASKGDTSSRKIKEDLALPTCIAKIIQNEKDNQT
ncbi:hypothetical protein THRCLA_23081 [Thraustotheca clavata]|uniref:Tc3 transposase DNA binding domain-containing protein n=1 Tax=Thraustotheca clavata TaxID=74557 RepID=A0A1V9YFC9_9STRA|nr:hypothetical protein THRCLA_23081 [Thraustotheca clavata]